MKNLLKIITLQAMLLLAVPGFAQHVGVGIHIQIGPPAPREEVVVVRPYPDAVWVPGYYVYDPGVGNYVWITGRWRHPPHRGSRWIAPEWRHEKGEYHFHRGRWK